MRDLTARKEELTASEKHSGLRRTLSRRHIQMIAIGGAIGTGLFLGSGRTIGYAGPSIIFIYMIIGFFVFFIMRALGEMLLSNLHYKTFADLAKDLIGPWAGYFVNWNYWLACVVAGIADVVAITAYMKFFDEDVPVWLVAVVTSAVLLFFNLQPVKWFGELEFWFAVSKVVTIVALLVVGSIMIVTGFTPAGRSPASLTHLWDAGGMFPMGAAGFVLGFQIAIYAFASVELVGTVAAEAKEPHKTLPKAVNSVVLRVLLFYVGALIVIMSVTPWNQIDPNQSPFITVFSTAGFQAAAAVIGLVVIVSAASSGNSQIYAGVRMLYGLARDGHAPAVFARLSRGRIPVAAAVLTGGLVFLSVPLLYAGDSVLSAFSFVTSVCSVLILFTWSSILVSYLRYRRRHPDRHAASAFKMPLGRVMPWVTFGFFLFMLGAIASNPDTLPALLAAPFWFAFLAVMWTLRRRALARSGRPITGHIPLPDFDPDRAPSSARPSDHRSEDAS
ncbi:amino acid permease [Microbacterium enclense]|uniref:D-serine/D-alanine/glycine:proton symporter, AAT family (TC 2.A.3.1.7) n=1 Tax=Microbacterium enclense TaxID=993073 RepID=A0A1G6GZK6_9MICO|nr:amino acid permease [Microbacterium enclense]SDB86546.1 D-serine/D-alanine/glycine:proton symporter, AAT family (TC 2.A.3.1.7) [Microbacterium enclense]